ncbi:MAG: glycosyltransferase family 4 protein [Maritimibacter sp.]
MSKILIYWEGFPVCGLLTADLCNDDNYKVDIFATKPAVPFDRFFESYNVHPNYAPPENPDDIDLDGYDLLVVTGWDSKYWRSVCKRAKAMGITTCVVVDNNYRGSLKQVLGALYFRLKLRRLYDYAFCPGVSSQRLLTFLGMPQSNVLFGNYGAFSKIYHPRLEQGSVKSGFIFVGQFIKRKGVDVLLTAFHKYRAQGGSWDLSLYGSGDLSELVAPALQETEGLKILPFAQPADVARSFRASKVFVLPSVLEHWGTVVCESAACGCSLLLSSAVGSANDLLIPGVNGASFKAGDADELCAKMHLLEKLDEDWHSQASTVSISQASQKNEKSYSNALKFMLANDNRKR